MRSLQPGEYRAIAGQHYGTPKEVWGFRTPPDSGPPAVIARRFLRANAGLLGIAGIRSQLWLTRIIESLGATHVIFQQRHRDLQIHRAYVTVHINRAGRVYLVKNRAVPRNRLPPLAAHRVTRTSAIRRATRSLPGPSLPGPRRTIRVLEVRRMWFPHGGTIRPAFRVRVRRERPAEEWLVYLDALTGENLSLYDNLAQSHGRALVFDPNPVIAVGDWRSLVSGLGRRGPPRLAYREVRLDGLAGTGFLDGPRVSTSPTRRRVRRPDHRFLFASTQRQFGEVMVYYHLDRALRYVESLGYHGRRAIFTGPLLADASGTRGDYSWYSPGFRRLSFGRGVVADAEDAEIILHEFGHALQDAICPDFGQSAQAAAIGEGFGDYFAASFFAARKPPRFRPAVASWDGILNRQYDPPCLRRVDEQLTFEAFDHAVDGDEHENGKIWASTLWEIRQTVGRRSADRLIIEGHFQLDGFTTFAQAARAILDADRHLDGGRHGTRLRQIFHRRGIGPVE